MKLKDQARQLREQLSAVFLAYRRSDTPRRAKIVAAITVCYALSPIDLIPDFIPVLGYLDDLIILPLLIAWSIRLVPPEIMQECREQAASVWPNGKPEQAIYAVPIILFWVAVIGVIICAFD